MNKDTVIGVVGAAILLAAMVGVFQYEGARTSGSIGSLAFDVTWTSVTTNGPTAEDTTALGAESAVALNVTQANLTRVVIAVTWTAQTGADTLEVDVTPPAGSSIQAQSATGDSGLLELTFDVPNDVPAATTNFGNSEADAHRRLANEYTKRLGTGEWGVNVAFTDAQGLIPLPGAPPVQQDQEVTWTARASLTHYAPELATKS